MPYRTDRMKLDSPFLDRRMKLLPCQRERIHDMYHEDGVSMRQLARTFKVSRRLVDFICHPHRKEANLERRKANGGSMKYYDPARHAKATRAHRAHKNRVLKDRP